MRNVHGLLKLLRLGFVIFSALFVPMSSSAGEIVSKDHFPRTANYYLRWDLSTTQAYELARYGLLILDMEVQVNSPEQLKLIRSLNPNVKILAYVTSQEILKRAGSLPSNSLRRKLWNQISSTWYLTDAEQQRISYWPGTWMLNVSGVPPMVNGQRWNTFLPQFMHDEVMATGFWDGIFFDNAWDDVSFVNQGNIDLNGDGLRNEGPTLLDRAWADGMKEMLKMSRALEGRDALLVGNGGNGFEEFLNGRMFENFPAIEEGVWSGSMNAYRLHLQTGVTPTVSVINVNTDNSGIMDDFTRFRFGLASALMEDGFYSFDDGDQGHAVNWFFDEEKIELGRPLGPAFNVFHPTQASYNLGIWRRDFQQGIAVVNSADRVSVIDLGAPFETIDGVQDPTINTGEPIESLVLQPHDGRVLLRPLAFLDDVPLLNGSPTKVFSLLNDEVRKPFTAHEGRFGTDETVMRTDLNISGGRETIVSRGNAIRIFNDKGKRINRFFPYGNFFQGRVTFIAGDVIGDAAKEIVTSTDVGGGPQIRIFDDRGRMVHAGFFAFNRRQRGGASIAIGDVTGDGKPEMIVGGGRGSLPIVRIFSGSGKMIHQGFLVFDRKFRGGVSVAAGKLRNGKRAEIVVAPATGGGPHVRVFKADGSLDQPGFFAFEPSANAGLRLGVVDMNFDGQIEIIVQKNTHR